MVTKSASEPAPGQLACFIRQDIVRPAFSIIISAFPCEVIDELLTLKLHLHVGQGGLTKGNSSVMMRSH